MITTNVTNNLKLMLFIGFPMFRDSDAQYHPERCSKKASQQVEFVN